MKAKRWGVLVSSGLYAGCDWQFPDEPIVVAGHVSEPHGKPWPAATFTSEENAQKCLRWLGKMGEQMSARVVELRSSWEIVN